MTPVRHLDDLSDADLRAAYAPPRTPWLRLNFVQTVDGSAVGPDGLSKSINDAADARVFQTLRELADVIVVGAGTVREERYRPNPKPMVVVSRSGEVPESLREGDLSQVHLATAAAAPHLEESRDLLGDRVLVLGQRTPDLPLLRRELADAGFADLLCEGGPHLARDLLAAGLVDELCSTYVPRLVGGEGLRITSGRPIDLPLELAGMIEQDGTLLLRWFTGEVSLPATPGSPG